MKTARVTALQAVNHLPEYLIEALCLGLFMVSAGVVTSLLEYPGYGLRSSIADAGARRVLIGLAMGLTCVALVYSPWGRRSGAHMNPAVTLSFWSLGKVRGIDAVGYIVAQFIGGLLGVLLVHRMLGDAFSAAPVNWVATLPGAHGAVIACLAELCISFGMMLTVLSLSSSRRYARLTGIAAGSLVAIYIALEAPLSGMSMNPARSFASAAPWRHWQSLWIYFVAPCLGMLAAAQWHRFRKSAVGCAKLMHTPQERCIHCGQSPALLAVAGSAATARSAP
jgi:aquaporin Z